MLDNITSLFDNYKGKIRNPFIGTIISVWLIHNWRIPFALFNFDKVCTMQDKINYIADYFGKKDVWSELSEIIFYSFLILVFTFILMAISRVLTDTYYKIIEPFFITKIDKKSIFTEIEKTKLENRINSLTKKVEYKNDEIDKVDVSNNKLANEKLNLENELNEYIRRHNKEIEGLETELRTLKRVVLPLSSIYTDFDEIIKRFSASELKNLAILAENNTEFKHTNMSQTFVLLKEKLIEDEHNKIIILDNTYNPDEILNSKYHFTTFGKLFISYINSNKSLFI